MEFTGKVALITGGGGGIGRADHHCLRPRRRARDGGGSRRQRGRGQQGRRRCGGRRGALSRRRRVPCRRGARLCAGHAGRLGPHRLLFQQCRDRGCRRADHGIRGGRLRRGDRRQPQGRLPRPAPRAAGDGAPGRGDSGEHRVHRRPVRRARHARLRRLQARGARPDQGRLGRCRPQWRARQCDLPRPGGDADDALAGIPAKPDRPRWRSTRPSVPVRRRGATRCPRRSPTPCCSCARSCRAI